MIYFIKSISLTILTQIIAQEQCNKFKAYENYTEGQVTGIIQNIKRYDQNLGPIEDQDTIGNCYAHATADLLESHLKSKGLMPADEHISAIGIALSYKDKQIKEFEESYIEKARERIHRERTGRNTELTEEQIEKNKSRTTRFLNKGTLSGGNTSFRVIDTSWDRLCFESEVNSSDEHIKEIYLQHHWLFENNFYRSKNAESFINQLLHIRYNPFLGPHCGTYMLAKEIFPGMPFENPDDFHEFITKQRGREYLLDLILEKTCSGKNYGTKPKVSTNSKEILLSALNKHLNVRTASLKTIDSALNKGKIVSISYNAHIFKRSNKFILSNHQSTIVGNMSICGETYYIIRNSWGNKSCAIKMRKFSNRDSEQSKNDSKLYSCYNEAANIAKVTNIQYSECTRVECLEDREIIYQDELNECDKKYRAPYLEKIDHPFFCDPEGNYIVSGEHLKKGLFVAEFIDD